MRGYSRYRRRVPDQDVDIAAALAWAGSALGSPVTSYDALDGGLTSTMLVLRHDGGSESVLRLMTVEPWRRTAPS